jgi:hypothetical protein
MTTPVSPIDLKTKSTQKLKTRVYRTKAQWKALLEEYATSGLTQAEFCQKHHIATSSFYKWQKYFASQPAASDFIDITAPLAKAAPPLADYGRDDHFQVELELAPGVVLRVRAI